MDIVWFGFMMLNTTFKNISVISWRSVLLVKETGGPGENYRPVSSHWQTLSHNAVHLTLIEIPTHDISGDMQCLRRSLQIQLLCYYGHDGPNMDIVHVFNMILLVCVVCVKWISLRYWNDTNTNKTSWLQCFVLWLKKSDISIFFLNHR